MNHFISWCKKNNKNILNFTDTQENISKYCDFIQRWHSNDKYLNAIEYIEQKKTSDFKTLRMTAFELL